ncbi:hypothetical protein PLICRDRAFT_462733 [Plicaturopsis crispa FD-325 SS-3]|nr:hypothetical protein PLICRDRAFT_462733 [Plicaturopsis crispa FD-325 SS-3]
MKTGFPEGEGSHMLHGTEPWLGMTCIISLYGPRHNISHLPKRGKFFLLLGYARSDCTKMKKLSEATIERCSLASSHCTSSCTLRPQQNILAKLFIHKLLTGAHSLPTPCFSPASILSRASLDPRNNTPTSHFIPHPRSCPPTVCSKCPLPASA